MANKQMKTQIVLCNGPVLNKTECIYVWIYENLVKTKSSVFLLLFTFDVCVFIYLFFAFATTAVCNSYLARNVESLLIFFF